MRKILLVLLFILLLNTYGYCKEFFYQDKVRIVNGFYKGFIGSIIEPNGLFGSSTYYKVSINNGESKDIVIIFAENLEKY